MSSGLTETLHNLEKEVGILAPVQLSVKKLSVSGLEVLDLRPAASNTENPVR